MIFNKTINCYYRKYWYCFFFGILALIGVDAIQLLLPEIIGNIVRAANENELSMGFIGLQVLYILAIGLGIFAGRIIWRLLVEGVCHKIQADLRRRLFIHCEALPKEYHSSHKTGGTMALLTNDTEAVSYTFSDGVIFFVDIAVLGTLAMIKMFLVNWALALITIVPLVFLIFSGNILEKLETKSYEAQQKAFEKMSDFTSENLSGISVIKAFIKEKQQLKAFSNCANDHRTKALKFIRLDNAYNIIINGLIYISFALLLIIGGYLATNNVDLPLANPLTSDMLTEFYGYFDSLIWPMLAIVFLISTISRGKASCNRISELLNTPISVKDDEGVVQNNQPLKGNIKIQNLTFAYPDGETPVLKDCSVEIKAGENIGIIGRTGSGKTTFVNMLLKLYNVPRERIYIDGKDINDISTIDLRNSIGYVAQDTFLFSTSIAENIAFAHPRISFDAIKRAAKFACVDDNIANFKEGYDTIVGERGVSLSGGQKQRIAMARAIINDPEILILDDSVSAVDSSTEKEILSNIKRERKGKTTLIIAHRISAIENLDHIIILDEGQIVGYGTHQELLESNTYYQDIVKLQELEKEVK
ncbi:MAG TPA: ABC transporter ATP-binding protein [Firmicutes bacterium]|nr:ABC transporter ATP-binding protein [Bacillota bacterium]